MKAHRPDMVLSPAPGGLFVSRCLTCREACRPMSHKPSVEAWQKAHIKAAITVRPRFTSEARQP